MARNRKFVEHIHSNVPNKQPKPEVIELGELAVNTAPGKEFISLKNSSNEVIRLSSDEQLVTWMEKKTVMPYSGTVENIHLDTNRSNIELKFNQVAAPNTNFNEKVNGALDIDGNEVNPSSDSGKTNGAGIAIDTSVFALTGGNPTFSSITTSCGAELRGTTEILGADGECGSELNVEVNNVTIQSTGGTTCISSETDASLYGAENTKVGISCDDEVSEKTYVKGESVVVDATDGKLGITAKEDIITSSEGSIIVTADDNACVNAGDATTIYGQNSTNIGVNCSGNDESLSTNIYGEDIDVIGGSVDIESTASTVCVKANTNASLFGNAKTLVGVSCNGDMTNEVTVSGGTININSTGNTNVKVNNFNITGDTIIDGTLDPKSGLSKTLKWEYGKDVRNASSGKTNFSGDTTINLPNSVSGLNRSTLTIKQTGLPDVVYDPGSANTEVTINIPTAECGEIKVNYLSGNTFTQRCSESRIAIDTCSTSGTVYIPTTVKALGRKSLALYNGSFDESKRLFKYDPGDLEGCLDEMDVIIPIPTCVSVLDRTKLIINAVPGNCDTNFGGEYDPGKDCANSAHTINVPLFNEELKVSVSGTVNGTAGELQSGTYKPCSGGTIGLSAGTLHIGDKEYNPFNGSGATIDLSAYTLTLSGHNDSSCSGKTIEYNPFVSASTAVFGGIQFKNYDGTPAGTYCPIDGTSGVTITFPKGGVEPTAQTLTISSCTNTKTYNPLSDTTSTEVKLGRIKFYSGNTDQSNFIGEYCPLSGTGEMVTTIVVPSGGTAPQPINLQKLNISAVSATSAGVSGNDYNPSGTSTDPHNITISAASLTFSGKTIYNPFSNNNVDLILPKLTLNVTEGGTGGTYNPNSNTDQTINIPAGGGGGTYYYYTAAHVHYGQDHVLGCSAGTEDFNTGTSQAGPVDIYIPTSVSALGRNTLEITLNGSSIPSSGGVYDPGSGCSSSKTINISAGTLTISGGCGNGSNSYAYNPFSGNSAITLQSLELYNGDSLIGTYCPLSGNGPIKIEIPLCDKIDCDNDGCVLIDADLCVNGDVTADAFYASSDKRLKENICSISEEDLEKASKVELKSFNFSGGFDTEKKYGVIAQQVKEAGLDNLVSGKEEKGHYMSVDYTSLLILKIAELENKINALSEEIKELKKQ